MRVAVVTESGLERIDSKKLSTSEIVRAVGGNTGNLAFQQVIDQLVDEPVEYVSWRDRPEDVRDRFDILVVPEASVIAASKDFGWKADFVEHVDLPCVVLGVGFQDGRRRRSPICPAGTARYLRALASRTAWIGVRGERSYELVRGIGITNARVVGCPSMLWAQDHELGTSITERLERTGAELRPVVSVGPPKRVLRIANQRLTSWARRRHGLLVAQSGELLYRALDAQVVPDERSGRSELVPQAFTDARAWIDKAREYDAGLSPRVHATILATQAGIPAVLIEHDGRTAELARTCGLSTISLRRLYAEPAFDRLFSSGRLSMRFAGCRRDIATSTAELFQAAGLHPSEHLTALGSQG